MMDEINLVNIENRALATANPRIIRPIRIEIMGKIVAEDVPKLCEEVRRCWQRIAELEEALVEVEKEAAIRREAFIFQTQRLTEAEKKHES